MLFSIILKSKDIIYNKLIIIFNLVKIYTKHYLDYFQSKNVNKYNYKRVSHLLS